jgi:hypothetical protein
MPFARIAAATAVAALLAAGVAVAAPAATTPESYAALRMQIDAGKVKAATIYNRSRVIHASETGGLRYSVHYAPAQRAALIAALRGHHVRFHVLAGAGKKSHGLRRRYIALIVLAALIVAGGAAYAVARRRRAAPRAGA